VRRLAQYVVVVGPGGFSQNDIAKKIYKMLVDIVRDWALVKSIASVDKDCYDAAAGEVGGEEVVKKGWGRGVESLTRIIQYPL